MIFAKTEAAKTALQKNWDDAEKKYFAVVEGAPPQVVLLHPFGREAPGEEVA